MVVGKASTIVSTQAFMSTTSILHDPLEGEFCLHFVGEETEAHQYSETCPKSSKWSLSLSPELLRWCFVKNSQIT